MNANTRAHTHTHRRNPAPLRVLTHHKPTNHVPQTSAVGKWSTWTLKLPCKLDIAPNRLGDFPLFVGSLRVHEPSKNEGHYPKERSSGAILEGSWRLQRQFDQLRSTLD